MDKDEFEAWREHPLTMWFMDDLLGKQETEAKKTFVDYAWGRKEIDPIYHAALYERAEVLKQLRALTYEDIEALLSDKSKRN